MSGMFMLSSFNRNIEGWNTSSVINISSMFKGTSSFTNQDLSNWNVSNVTIHTDFMTGAGTGNTEPIW